MGINDIFYLLEWQWGRGWLEDEEKSPCCKYRRKVGKGNNVIPKVTSTFLPVSLPVMLEMEQRGSESNACIIVLVSVSHLHGYYCRRQNLLLQCYHCHDATQFLQSEIQKVTGTCHPPQKKKKKKAL